MKICNAKSGWKLYAFSLIYVRDQTPGEGRPNIIAFDAKNLPDIWCRKIMKKYIKN